LPWPFCRIVIAIGPPRQVPRTLQPAALEALQKEMALELKRLFGVARELRFRLTSRRRLMSVEFFSRSSGSATRPRTWSRSRGKSTQLSAIAPTKLIFVDDGQHRRNRSHPEEAQELACRPCAC
jgi:hypothetical protein